MLRALLYGNCFRNAWMQFNNKINYLGETSMISTIQLHAPKRQ